MVSKAREDFPEPDSPVTTVRVLRGMVTETLRRLCWRAPRTVMWVMPRGARGVSGDSCGVSIDEFWSGRVKSLGYGNWQEAEEGVGMRCETRGVSEWVTDGPNGSL